MGSSTKVTAAAAAATITIPTGAVPGPLPVPGPEDPERLLGPLVHPILNHIPLHMRFGMSGMFCNITKIVLYNVTVELLRGIATPARIYSVLDIFMMFVGHGMGCLIVFGWPERYWTNFMTNTPVGILGMIIGTSMTAYLTNIHFNDRMIHWIKTDFTVLRVREEGDVYTSLVVMTVCNVWTFVAANIVNRPKYLKAFKDHLV